jgi:hypothetical protein
MPPSAVATGALECGSGACEAAAVSLALGSVPYCEFDLYPADALRLLLQRAVEPWRPPTPQEGHLPFPIRIRS